jgi:dethiobiotin synthetase
MRILVIGTDIGVGETWVGSSLARALEQAGKAVVAIEPHALLGLAQPLASAVTSERSGEEIDFDGLVLKIERYAEQAEYAIIQGAGGLLTPVTWEWNMADVARAVGAVALVVGVDRLGTINHTLLTLSALELAGLPCLGVVLTTPKLEDASTGKNAPAIARLSGIDRVITLPVSTDEQQSAAMLLEPVLSWVGRVAAPA